MPSEIDMSVCPKAVITSRPGKESWSYEELWDTIFEIDHEGKVVKTKYRGVYLVFTKTGGLNLARLFTRYLHAFISTVVPADLCLKIPTHIFKIPILLRKIEGAKNIKLILVRLRGASKNVLEHIPKTFATTELIPLNKEIIVIEGIDDLVLLSIGRFERCGPQCKVLIPEVISL